jgi:hypothetical protein
MGFGESGADGKHGALGFLSDLCGLYSTDNFKIPNIAKPCLLYAILGRHNRQ